MVIYGKQLFLHLIKNHSDKIVQIYLAKECDKGLFSQISKLNKKIIKVDNQKAQALAKGGNHQGFLCEVREFNFAIFSQIKSGNFVAILYELTDIGNIGAIIRTAHALGASGVLIINKNASNLTQEKQDAKMQGVIRASSCAAYEIPVCAVSNGLDALNELKQAGFSLISTQMDGENINKIKPNLKQKVALIMGNEGEGLPQKVSAKSDFKVGIKMKNSWDSLNVSAAFAILCDRIINE